MRVSAANLGRGERPWIAHRNLVAAERNRLDPLVRGEALAALQALAPTADRLADLRVPGVHDLEVVVTAVRTSHPLTEPSPTLPALDPLAEERRDVQVLLVGRE